MIARQIQVLVGPLSDYQQNNTSSALNIVSTGADDDLAISFSVQKTIASDSNRTSITVSNLSKDTRQKFMQSGISVQLFAGYVGSELSLVSKGGVLSAVSQRSGTEINTVINALDGFGASLRAFYSKTFAGKTAVRDVVLELARTFENVSIGEINVSGNLASKGRAFFGRSVDTLDNLADAFGFSWSIQNNVFTALDDEQVTSKIYVLDSDKNLLNVAPILNGVLQKQVGVEVIAVLDPRIAPGDKIRVRSSVNPELNNDYKVTECQLSGSSHSDDWTIQIKSLSTLL